MADPTASRQKNDLSDAAIRISRRYDHVGACLFGSAANMTPANACAAQGSMSDFLRALAERGVKRRFAKDKVLINEGEIGDTLFIILSGRLRSFSADDADDREFIGREEREIIYHEYGPGEYIGEMILKDGKRSASVKAIEDSVCSVVNRRTLEVFIAENPAFALELIAKLIELVRKTTLLVNQLAFKDVYYRIKFLFESLAQTQPDGSRLVAQSLTQREIAGRIGSSRPMVNKVMKHLKDGGFTDDTSAPLRLLKNLPSGF
jgi:CRP/FNR family cyclic AMP-dependent transcriptional regulator